MSDYSRLLLEFNEGPIELLLMPTDRHQTISQFILYALNALIGRIGGKVLYSPARLRTGLIDSASRT